MIFDDIAREHHVLVGDMNDDISGGVRAPQMHKVNPAVAQIDRHVIVEGGGGIGQPWDTFMALKQPWEPLKFAVPILLTTFDHHGAGRVAHDNLVGVKGRSAQYPHRVIMGQHQMADWLVGD